MLLFNLSSLRTGERLVPFKNILCYCLTNIAKLAETLKKKNKNILCYCLTRRSYMDPGGTQEFKNILCYCLTFGMLTPASVAFVFKNILCYCLTLWKKMKDRWNCYLKTSYVIV